MILKIELLFFAHHQFYESEEVLVVCGDQLRKVWHITNFLFNVLSIIFIVKHQRQSCKAQKPAAFNGETLSLVAGASQVDRHGQCKQKVLGVHPVLAELAHLGVNEHALACLFGCARILQVKAIADDSLISLLKPVVA